MEFGSLVDFRKLKKLDFYKKTDFNPKIISYFTERMYFLNVTAFLIYQDFTNFVKNI